MKRRQFVKGAGIAAAAGAGGLAAPAIAQERIEWAMVLPWPKGAPGVGVNAERFPQRVDQMSSGRPHLKLYAAGQLVATFARFAAFPNCPHHLLPGPPPSWLRP